MPLLIGLLLLLALIPFALYRGSQVPEAEAVWWNESWQYRQSIAVTNNTTQQTNVYISVSLDTSNTSKFQADCGDLRFTKQNGQLLPYFIVSDCGTASTSVHVQLDTFPAGAQTFYAYYGNPSADNGFSSADFLIAASSYTVGGTGSEETGPGPVAYWKFDEGSGQIAHDSAGYSPGEEVLVDGDMEAGDVNAWTAAYSILSKESDTPHGDSNYLRITPTAGYPAARQQVLTIGQSYRFRGWVRIQAGYEWRVRCTTTNIITGFGNGDWEYIDVYFEATTDTLGLSGVNSGVPVEWDDVSVIKTSSGNHGTISGATWANEDQCVNGKCLSFDGVDDHVDMNSAVFSGPGAISFSAWFKTVDTRSINNTILGGGVNSTGQSIEFNVENGVLWARNWGNTASGGSGYNDGQWHHLVWTKEESVGVSGWKAYIDGSLINLSTTGSTILNFGSSNTLVGKSQQASRHFNGLIDEVKIFPYALTEDQIKTEYNLGAAAVMGTGPTVAPPAGGTLSNSLVAHWAFDEQYGQIAHDKVGNNHGTFGASTSPGGDDPTWKPAGECKVNGCLGFDGGDYIAIPDSSALKPSALTISGWVKLSVNLASQTASFPIIVDKYTLATNTGYRMLLERNTDKLSFSILNGSTIYQASLTSASSTLGTDWHHLTGVFDGTNVYVYVDGSLKATAPANTTISYGTETLYIGSYDGSQHFLQGSIDGLKIYNTALTADQVKQDMNAGASVAYSVGSEEADELADGAGAPPIAEWKFDEKQGTVAYDSSGNANDGTVSGATWKSGCQQGACLSFDATDDYVSLGANALQLTGDYTVESWIKAKEISVGGPQHIFGTYGRRLGLGEEDGSWHFINYSSVSGNQILTAPATANNWAHLVGVKDTSTGMKLYVNGALVDGNSFVDDSAYVNGDTRIGMDEYQYPNRGFNGLIDHVRIYDYARTPAQIAYDYNRGAPVAHWKFDECEGSVAHDASGNENHGTINIGATGTVGTCSTSGAWANGASGKFEGSLSFDGADDYVESPHNDIFNLKLQQSFSFWYGGFTETGTLERTFIDKSTSHQAANGYSIDMRGLDGFRFNLSTTRYILGKPSSFNDGDWHHVVVVLDQSANEVELYFDGELFSTTDISGATYATNTDSFLIGTVNISSSYYYFLKAKLDDVRIYNYTLSPAQVQKIYNQGYGVRYGN